MVPGQTSPARQSTSAKLLTGAACVVITSAILASVSACTGAADGGTRASRPVASATATSSPTGMSTDLSGSSPSPAVTPFDPETFAPPAVSVATLRKQFGYDPKAPLHVRSGATRTQDGATIASITYEVAGGPPVPAELVVPVGQAGRHPGVVLAHGGAIDPNAFLVDAIALAHKGMVSILPDIPMTITGDPETDIAFVTRAVISERRALDILVTRSDVNASRLGFAGHSWGADLAAIMAGVEPRLRAVVIACATSRMATDMITMARPADDTAYLAATSLLDGYRFVAMPGSRQLLIQYGTQDTTIPLPQRQELTTRAAGHKQRKDYDAGHDLINFPAAATDRITFLTTTLR
jgi:dienelactone hydrolase